MCNPKRVVVEVEVTRGREGVVRKGGVGSARDLHTKLSKLTALRLDTRQLRAEVEIPRDPVTSTLNPSHVFTYHLVLWLCSLNSSVQTIGPPA